MNGHGHLPIGLGSSSGTASLGPSCVFLVALVCVDATGQSFGLFANGHPPELSLLLGIAYEYWVNG
eukprot:CAMPEP_0197232860 /NCGR_PEP_ID=MMETSP1429-20130617/1082_1 /TAXON_ID=49237 /ORGANISM="Chaetoceros  sp., Strain UNC1202" /LENGTH=65 /DNA_ID=CAMNT_0042691001 /DNA_START=383 /DNA_END=577 /DNA_ORIENTATION=+